MSNVIQTTTQFEPISISFTVQRKGISKTGTTTTTVLPTYTFVVYNADNTTVSPAPTFPGSYFVPIYDPSDPDYTTVRFQASLNGVYSKNYPVQLEWDFGDGTKVSTYSESTANINNAPKTGACSVTSTGWNEATKVVTYTTTEEHGLSVGNSITISNVDPIDYNGTFTINTVPSTTTFTISGFKFNPGPSRTDGTFKSLTYPAIYHKYQYDGGGVTAITAGRLPVTLSVIDLVGRKIVASRMVYPKIGV
jgi:hypothetical protein